MIHSVFKWADLKSETYGFTQSFAFILRGIHINKYSHYMYMTPTEVQMAQTFWNLGALIQEHYKKPWPAFPFESSPLVYAWFLSFWIGISKYWTLLKAFQIFFLSFTASQTGEGLKAPPEIFFHQKRFSTPEEFSRLPFNTYTMANSSSSLGNVFESLSSLTVKWCLAVFKGNFCAWICNHCLIYPCLWQDWALTPSCSFPCLSPCRI